jgi:two-component system cell cycle response regulator DivK
MMSTGNRTNSQRCILIIEDDLLSLKMISLVMAAQGYRALEAIDGALGLELARRARPDLIITDVQLPSISGLEVSRTLKADPATRDIPIIVTTTFGLDEEELRASGCDGFMPKPIRVGELVQLVERTLRVRGAARDID